MGPKYSIATKAEFIREEDNKLPIHLDTRYAIEHSTYVYVYHNEYNSWILKQEIAALPAGNKVIKVDDPFYGSNKGNGKYLLKWYSGDGFFSSTLAISDPFQAWDRNAKLVSTIKETIKDEQSKALSVQLDLQHEIARLKEELERTKAEKNQLEEMKANKTKKRPKPSEDLCDKSIGMHERKVWRKYFDEIDEDLNGEITPEELKKYLKNLDPPVYLHDSIIKSMVEEADTDKNGVISLDEFILMMYVADSSMAQNQAWQNVRQRITSEMQASTPRVRKTTKN